MYILMEFTQTSQQRLRKKGLDVVAAEAFTADNKTDFSVQIQKAKMQVLNLYSFQFTIRKLL